VSFFRELFGGTRSKPWLWPGTPNGHIGQGLFGHFPGKDRDQLSRPDADDTGQAPACAPESGSCPKVEPRGYLRIASRFVGIFSRKYGEVADELKSRFIVVSLELRSRAPPSGA